MRKPAASHTVSRGHVIRLDPTLAKANALARACGVFAPCRGTRRGRKIGPPTFRKRGVNDSFYVANDKFRISLGMSEYHCEECGYQDDRDRNAAINLEQYPRLEGNWSRETRTSTGDRAPTSPVKTGLVGAFVEVETKP